MPLLRKVLGRYATAAGHSIIGHPKLRVWFGVHIGNTAAWELLARRARSCPALLGGSWVVISGVISKVTIVITQRRGLTAVLITTHEPPSTLRCRVGV